MAKKLDQERNIKPFIINNNNGAVSVGHGKYNFYAFEKTFETTKNSDQKYSDLLPPMKLSQEPTEEELIIDEGLVIDDIEHGPLLPDHDYKLQSVNVSRVSEDTIQFSGLQNLPELKMRTHITNYADTIMKELFHDPSLHMVQWPNTTFLEARASKGLLRNKKPDFLASGVSQLSANFSAIFVGEVSPLLKKSRL